MFMVDTWNVDVSINRSRHVAENNGTLVPLEIFAIINLLRSIGPLLINLLEE